MTNGTSKKLYGFLSSKKTVIGILSILFFILLLPMIQAAEFDNVGEYNETTRTMTIINLFGFGDTIAKITLLSPDNVLVIHGDDRKVAWFHLENFEEYEGSDAFGVIEVIDLNNNNEPLNKNIKFKSYNPETIEIIDNVITCDSSGTYYTNGTEILGCSTEEITREIIQEDWKAFNKNSLLEIANYTLGLFTEVKREERADWIPTFYGVEIPQWAEWTASLNVGLTDYWFFNEGTGTETKNEVNGSRNISFTNSPDWQTSSINGNKTLFRKGSTQFGNTSEDIGLTGINPWTISMWSNLTGINSGAGNLNHHPMFKIGTLDNNVAGCVYEYDWGSSTWRFCGLSVAETLTTVGNLSLKQHLLIYNGTGINWFINGTKVANSNVALTLVNNPFTVAKTNTAARFWNGTIEEIGIWNRALTDQEAIDLYNDGIGIFFIPFPFIINLNSPANNLVTIETTINFNASVSVPPIINLTNSTLRIFNTGSTLNRTQTINISTNVSQDVLFTETNLGLGIYDWNVEACGINTSSGIECATSTSNRTFEVRAFEIINESFNNDSFETDLETFQINISTLASILSVSAVLSYDAVEYTTNNIACNASGFCSIQNSIDVPLITITTSQNQIKTWFWNISVFDGTNEFPSGTTVHSQNVTRIHLEQCNSTYPIQALNFTAFDEVDNTRIDPYYFAGTFQSWLGLGSVKRNDSFSNVSTSEINLCIAPVDRNFTIDANIEYNDMINSTAFNTRNYFFQQDLIRNVSQDIFLFLLNVDDSTSFILKVQDTNLLPVVDALIITERFNPATGNFSIVQIAKTDDNGQSVGFFKTETVDYRFTIRKNGVILLQTTQQKVIPETAPFTLTFTIGIDESAPWVKFEDLPNLTSVLIFNKSTANVTFVYIDTSTNFEVARLVLQRNNASGFSQTICDINITLSSSTLICGTANVTATYTASAFVTRDGEVFLVEKIIFKVEIFAGIAGLLGVFLAWFMILISAFAFKFNEIAGIVLMNVVVIMVNVIGFVNFGSLFIFGMMGVSIIIMVLLKR